MTAAATALVLEAPRRLVARSLPLPDIGDDDALLRVEACGLCGTDHEQYSGELHPGYPFVPGHETVGTIVSAGRNAVARWGVEVGQRVAVEVFQSCRSCGHCRAGAYRRCERHGITDMYGFVPLEKAPGLWGGYATFQYLGPDSMILPVPDGLDPVLATLFNPVGAGVRWAVTVPGTSEGDVVAVLGCGVRGLAALVAAKEAGASFVMVTGRGARDAERLATARRFGADLVVDVESADPVAELKQAAGGGADVVVDVTAKAPAAFGQAVALARAGGTVVLAGTRGSDATPGLHPDHIVYKELRIMGALGVDVDAYRAALGLIASGRHPFVDIPRRTVGLDGVAGLLEDMSGSTANVPPMHGVVVP
ncbi:MAG TPA: alcohol dehydrogenase catalytic domain-containing protein [Acidimicrobiales bacterium]|nr:alcohol dehydrogenase catalytic domain-containing protein [Acidimicrobiales bacterium]